MTELVECPCCPQRYEATVGADSTCPGCGTTLPADGLVFARPEPHRANNIRNFEAIWVHCGSGDER